MRHMTTQIAIGKELLIQILSGKIVNYTNGGYNTYTIMLDNLTCDEYMKAVGKGMMEYPNYINSIKL